MRDLLPEEMIKRNYVFDIIKSVFIKYGFDPLESPSVEYSEVLEGKYGEEEKLIYKFKDKGGRDLALRYDLTVPLSRIIAANPNLNKPFKRFQISRVWRYDRPGKGRYKEFWQCDVDVVGSDSILADAEIIAVTIEIMEDLGFKDYTVRLNNRKILNSILESVGVPEKKYNEVLISIDKLERIGIEGVKKELREKELSPKQINGLSSFFDISGNNQQILNKLKKTLKNGKGEEGLNEMYELVSYLDKMGLPKKYKIMVSLARGLDYYTGPTFETVLNGVEMGSVSGGGRFDKLIGKFSGTDIPATGTSIGIERIIDVMKELNFDLPKQKTLTKVLVVNVDESTLQDCIKLASFLRKNNVSCQFNLSGKKFGKQIKYADSLGIQYLAIIGKEELKQNKVTLKDMVTGKQRKVNKEALLKIVS